MERTGNLFSFFLSKLALPALRAVVGREEALTMQMSHGRNQSTGTTPDTWTNQMNPFIQPVTR